MRPNRYACTFMGGLLALGSGCSTMTRGAEKVHIRTVSGGNEVTGADCTLKIGDKQWTLTTPGSVKLPHQGAALLVRCEKPGYVMENETVPAHAAPGRSLAGGAGGGAGVAAVAGLPLLMMPIIGWAAYGTVVAGGAVVGTAASAGTDTATGAIYEYPSEIDVPLSPAPQPAPAEAAPPAAPSE